MSTISSGRGKLVLPNDSLSSSFPKDYVLLKDRPEDVPKPPKKAMDYSSSSDEIESSEEEDDGDTDRQDESRDSSGARWSAVQNRTKVSSENTTRFNTARAINGAQTIDYFLF
ncbi:hypothetical protein NDU88_000124 [Pleurodeles waltl]|uniref:Uncharacterized protein n=1 Tax=Pleurodeles waltl TaxID=8319 RepID=A0AAV7KW69_PLEWA|nr:hypothetical protein NDU88_000124 [Pleurodeles waltl]